MKHPPTRLTQATRETRETNATATKQTPGGEQPKTNKGCYHSPWVPRQDAGDLVDFLGRLFWDRVCRCNGGEGEDPDEILDLLRKNFEDGRAVSTKRDFSPSGIAVFRDQSLVHLDNMVMVATTKGDWRVEAGILGDGNTGWVVCAEHNNAGGFNNPAWEIQDPKDGSPGLVMVKNRKGRVFLSKETHYRCGLAWDPSPEVCAENVYREDGGVRWRARRVGGKLNGRGKACFESFWSNNIPMIIEYGVQGRGKHREVDRGGAYQEFFPDGKLALMTYAFEGKQVIGPAGFCEVRYSAGGVELERKTKPGESEAISCSTTWAISISGFCRRHPDVCQKFPQELGMV